MAASVCSWFACVDLWVSSCVNLTFQVQNTLPGGGGQSIETVLSSCCLIQDLQAYPSNTPDRGCTVGTAEGTAPPFCVYVCWLPNNDMGATCFLFCYTAKRDSNHPLKDNKQIKGNSDVQNPDNLTHCIWPEVDQEEENAQLVIEGPCRHTCRVMGEAVSGALSNQASKARECQPCITVVPTLLKVYF